MEDSVAAFTPTEDDIKSNGVRRIYCSVPLDYDEEEALAEFRTFAQGRGYRIPQWADDERRVLLRFLDSVGRSAKKALQSLIKHERWRNTEIPVRTEEVRQLLREGIMYTFGRDKRMRPVIVICGEKISRRNLQPHELLRVSYYVLEYIKSTKFIPGKIETWLIILDLANVPLDQTPISALKTMMKALKRHYCCTLFRMFVVNSSSLISGIWRIVQFFLESVTRKKIAICSDDFRPLLREVISEDQLERRFGGRCDDVLSGFEPSADRE